jgi:hypothetical protein
MAPPLTLTRVLRDCQVSHRGEGDAGEGLIDLDQVEVADAQDGAVSALRVTSERVPDRVGRLSSSEGSGPAPVP